MLRFRLFASPFLKELVVVGGIVYALAITLLPGIAQSSTKRTCLTNLMKIGQAAKLFADDHGGYFPSGTYPYQRNWEVNPDTNPYLDPVNQCLDNFGWWRGYVPPSGGPAYSGCAYGTEFYRTLMHIQLKPYLADAKTWYCPQDSRHLPSVTNVSLGVQSYHWFPNWVFNTWCSAPGPFPCVHYTGGQQYPTNDWPVSPVYSPLPNQRILFGERGIFGWDGPDGRNESGNPAPTINYNHPTGYNVLYFDGHTGSIPFGNKWKTIPASGWPASQAP